MSVYKFRSLKLQSLFRFFIKDLNIVFLALSLACFLCLEPLTKGPRMYCLKNKDILLASSFVTLVSKVAIFLSKRMSSRSPALCVSRACIGAAR